MRSLLASRQTEGYRVNTEVYSGPLDLLLQLIERAELDITRLALAQVTDQYIAYMRCLQEQDVAEVSAFLVIAARLLQIKSSALLPRPIVFEEVEEEDAGDALVRQLIEYRKFKRVADVLAQREAAGLRTYLRMVPPPLMVEAKLDLEGINLDDVILAARQIFITLSLPPLAVMMSPQRITIREKIHTILDTLRKRSSASFRTVLQTGTRLEVVVTFLALLELIKRHVVVAQQPSLFDEIEMRSVGEIDEQTMELEFEE
ncbi:MAG: segregation/condensation protein A [Anaerolineae bacterium]|nr:segregation/condensation protein A [Anaerolineae bacterium]